MVIAGDMYHSRRLENRYPGYDRVCEEEVANVIAYKLHLNALGCRTVWAANALCCL